MATYNLLHGRSPSDGLVDPARLAAAIATLDTDILALQEVDRTQPRSHHLDLTTIAAEALGATTHRFAAAVVGTPGEHVRAPTHDGDGDGQPCYGIGLVTRYPANSWHLTRLPAAPVRSPVIVAGRPPYVRLLRDEPRVLLAAVLDTPIGTLTAATTHLSFVPGWNLHQLRTALRALRALPPPRLLLGDLNLPAGLAVAASGWRALARRPTWPASRPRVQLDHILLDPRGGTPIGVVTDIATPALEVSDHRPLVVTVRPEPTT